MSSDEQIDCSKIPNPEIIFLMNNRRVNYYDYFPRECNAVNRMQENFIKNAMLDHSYNMIVVDESKTKPSLKSTHVFHEDDDEISDSENTSTQTLSPRESPVVKRKTSPLTICVTRRKRKIEFDDINDEFENETDVDDGCEFLMPYNKNMVRNFTGTEDHIIERKEHRKKNSLAVRMSRAKTKYREEQKGAVCKEAKKENVVAKRTTAAYLIYLNLLQASLKRNEVNWTQEWTKQKANKDKSMASA